MTRVLLTCLMLAFFALPAMAREAPAVHATHNPPAPVASGPLDEPGIDEPDLAAWAAGAVAMTMTFSHINVDSAMEKAEKHYTKDGWKSFTTALKKSYILETMKANEQTVTATVGATPVVTKKGVEGLLDKRYRWTLEMPMKLTYEGKQGRMDNLIVEIAVERAPVEETPAGIGITQWIARVK